jgi:hypothetical protein
VLPIVGIVFVLVDVGTCVVMLVRSCPSLAVRFKLLVSLDVGCVWLILMLSHSLVILFV